MDFWVLACIWISCTLACFETCLFGRGLRGWASFGGRETLRLLRSLPTVYFDSFLDGDCVVWLLLGGWETLRLLTSLPTVLTPFWTGIASFGFFWGARDFASIGFFWGARDFSSSLTSLPTVLTPSLDRDCVASRLLFWGERLCFFSRVCRLFWHFFGRGLRR